MAFFARAFCVNEFEEQGFEFPVAQANISFNHSKQTLRGLHYQKEPYREAKLLRCTKGSIYDVIIDLRPESTSYKQWIGVELNEQNYRMLYVPGGFAHGYFTLEDETEVMYHVSEFYTPGAESGIRWNDETFKIDWPTDPQVISDKDKNWPDFQETAINNKANI